MGNAVNKLRLAKVKKSLNEGKSYKRALLDAGYSKNTAEMGSHPQVIRKSLEELRAEIDLKTITPDWILKGLATEAAHAEKSGDRREALAYLGKYYAMFTERTKQEITAVISAQDKAILDSYIQTTPTVTHGHTLSAGNNAPVPGAGVTS